MKTFNIFRAISRMINRKSFNVWYATEKTAPCGTSIIHCTDYHRVRIIADSWRDAEIASRIHTQNATVLGITETDCDVEGTYRAADNDSWSWQHRTPSLAEALTKTYCAC